MPTLTAHASTQADVRRSLFWLVAAMLVIPPAISIGSYAAAVTLGGPISSNPIRVMVRVIVGPHASDSWGPMIQALAFAQHHGAGLYDEVFFRLHQKFQYPPTSLLGLEALQHFVPVTSSTLNRLNAVIFAVNALGCALLLSQVVGRDSTRSQGSSARLPVLALSFVLAYTFWPTLYGLYLGQIQIWIDALFTFAVLLWIKGHRLGSGILTGIACTIKPQLGLLVFWALLWGERDFLLGLAGSLAGIGLVSVLRYGLANHLNYLDVLSYISHHGESFHANQSVNGLMNRLLFLGNNLDWDPALFAPYNPVVYGTTLVSALVFTAFPFGIAIRARKSRACVMDLCIATLCFTLASPIAWEHHYGVTLPMYVIAFGLAVSRTFTVRRTTLLAALSISFVLVGANLQVLDIFSPGALNLLQTPMLLGALPLLFVLLTVASSLRPPRTSGHDRPCPESATLEGHAHALSRLGTS